MKKKSLQQKKLELQMTLPVVLIALVESCTESVSKLIESMLSFIQNLVLPRHRSYKHSMFVFIHSNIIVSVDCPC